MKGAKEGDTVKACLQYLKIRGVVAWRQNSGAFVGEYRGKRRFVRFNTMPGCSDIIGIMPRNSTNPGAFLAIEVKQPGKKPSPEQAAFLSSIDANGGVGMAVWSLSELMKEMEQYLGPA